MNDSIEHRRIRFEGRVQGVGFRATCNAIVKRVKSLAGWVRNEYDGSVLLHVQGPPTDIDAALDQIRQRFSGNITGEDVDRQPVDDELTTFSVRH